MDLIFTKEISNQLRDFMKVFGASLKNLDFNKNKAVEFQACTLCTCNSSTQISCVKWIEIIYCKVASSSLSRLVAHFWIFRLFMKGKFDAYVLWPFAKRVKNWNIVATIWICYSFQFGQRSRYISIKFSLHKQSENPKMCYYSRQATVRDFTISNWNIGYLETPWIFLG